MTRKDYTLIAHYLHKEYSLVAGTVAQPGFDSAVRALSHACAHDNERYDAEKFYEAVYKGQDK